jgi:Zinc knuckle
MTDMQMKLVFFSTLPPEYTVVQSKNNRIIESTPIDTIITDIKDHHGMFNLKVDPTETGLALMGQHTDSEKCKHCGRNNHKSDECFYKNGCSQRTPRDISQIMCYNCNQKGHYANKCPKRNTDEKEPVKSTGSDTGSEPKTDDMFCGYANLSGEGIRDSFFDNFDTTGDTETPCMDGVSVEENITPTENTMDAGETMSDHAGKRRCRSALTNGSSGEALPHFDVLLH